MGISSSGVKQYSPSVASRKSRAAVLWLQERMKKSGRKIPTQFETPQPNNSINSLIFNFLSHNPIVLLLHGTLQISFNLGEPNVVLLRLRSPGDREKEAY